MLCCWSTLASESGQGGRTHHEWTAETLAALDAVVLVTDHAVVDNEMVVAHASLVVDIRDVLKGYGRSVVKA